MPVFAIHSPVHDEIECVYWPAVAAKPLDRYKQKFFVGDVTVPSLVNSTFQLDALC